MGASIESLVSSGSCSVLQSQLVIECRARVQSIAKLAMAKVAGRNGRSDSTSKIRSFRSEKDFEKWLAANHARESELWLKIHKKDSGLPTVTSVQAIDVALCWGWIDGLRKGFDERSFLQRFTPRGAKSIWSQINRENVARLIADRSHDAARIAVCRAPRNRTVSWDAAYAPIRCRRAKRRFRDGSCVPQSKRSRVRSQTFRTLNRAESILADIPHEQYEDTGRDAPKRSRISSRHAGSW